MTQNRTGFQALTDLRAREAEILLNNGCCAGAYYLIGYSVECALKAVIVRRFNQDELPDKRLVFDCYTHDLDDLLKLSGLKPQHDQQLKSDLVFAGYWDVVKDWSEDARYEVAISDQKARELVTAVTDPQHGVLPWIKRLW